MQPQCCEFSQTRGLRKNSEVFGKHGDDGRVEIVFAAVIVTVLAAVWLVGGKDEMLEDFLKLLAPGCLAIILAIWQFAFVDFR